MTINIQQRKKFGTTAAILGLVAISFLTPLPWTVAKSAHYIESQPFELDEIDACVELACAVDSCKAHCIDSLLRNAYERGAFSGQFIYAEHGKVIYNNCFGFSDIRRKRDSIRPESAFQLASLSKPFTAVAVMQLYQAGRIDIYAPVQTYLKDFPFDNITVKDLLQHRSGLKNYIYLADRYWPDKHKTLTNKDISPLLNQYGKTLEFKPGTRFKYCNTNYAYLAELVEEVSGETFAEYFDKHIAAPLHMEHTFVYDYNNPRTENVVNGYSYSRRNGFYRRYPDYLDGVVGDKGLYSTAEDLMRFDRALYLENFLADSIREMMFTPAEALRPGHDCVYGIGFRVKEDTAGNQTVFHNGWWKGFRTYFTHDYQHERTLIWLINRSDVTVNPHIEEIFRISDSFGDPLMASANENKKEKGLNRPSQQPVSRLDNMLPEENDSKERKLLKRDETYGSESTQE